METKDELCRQARELYRWDLRFEGDFISAPRLEIADWMAERARPSIGIGREQMESRPTYGFMDRNRPAAGGETGLYAPFATIYPGRELDYQGDLLQAALLHLRHTISGKPADILFPALLHQYVRPDHLLLLEPGNPKVEEFRGGKVRIFVEEAAAVGELFASFEIQDTLPQ